MPVIFSRSAQVLLPEMSYDVTTNLKMSLDSEVLVILYHVVLICD